MWYDTPMDRIIYDILTGLPSKVVNSAIGVAGIAATAWPERFKNWVSANMTPDQIRIYGIIAISLTIMYWLVMAWLRPKNSTAEQTPAITASTQGAGSPAIGNITNSTVNFNPATSNEIKKPSYDLGLFNNALSAALSGQSATAPERDMLLKEVFEYLMSIFPNKDGGAINHLIADVCNEKDLHIWGRRESYPIRLIYMRHTLQIFGEEDSAVTHSQTPSIHGPKHDLWSDVQFNRAEVIKAWPAPVQD